MTEKFTPEEQIPLKELKPIIKEAERQQVKEAIREGSLVPEQEPGDEQNKPENEIVRKPRVNSSKYIPKNVFIEKSFKDN